MLWYILDVPKKASLRKADKAASSGAVRKPTSPGEILRKEYLEPMGMTQKELSIRIGCDIKVINRIVNGRNSVTAEMAVRIGTALETTPELWLNAQQAIDLYEAKARLKLKLNPKASGP